MSVQNKIKELKVLFNSDYKLLIKNKIDVNFLHNKYLGRKGLFRLKAVCMVTTAPTNKEIMITIPKEFNPIFSISKINCLKKIVFLSGILNTLRNSRKY